MVTDGSDVFVRSWLLVFFVFHIVLISKLDCFNQLRVLERGACEVIHVAVAGDVQISILGKNRIKMFTKLEQITVSVTVHGFDIILRFQNTVMCDCSVGLCRSGIRCFCCDFGAVIFIGTVAAWLIMLIVAAADKIHPNTDVNIFFTV